MKVEEIKKLIKKFLQEYTGTGSSGGNSTDGNDIPSPRPFADDLEELEHYLNKSIYGGEGGHYRKDKYTGNYPNRHKMVRFEQIDPATMQRFSNEKIKLQKQLANIDIKISRETLSAASDAAVKSLNATISSSNCCGTTLSSDGSSITP